MSFFEAMFGDDFPDAFAYDGRSCKSNKTLLDLPAEILEIICRYLSGLDVKRLRLTSRELAEKADLRIDRVYVSPNRANLDCLNNILNHPQYRLQVRELVWDDGQLEQLPTFELFQDRIESDEKQARIALEDHLSTLFESNTENEADYESIGVQDCLLDDGELTDIGKAILLNANDERSKNIIVSRAASMGVEDSYDLYQKLYQDEREIIKRGWDENALLRALEQLPNLRRITITTEVWRPWNLTPLYDTPFRRALPAGFRKPSVGPWTDWGLSELLRAGLARDGFVQDLSTEARGFSILMSSLASKPVFGLQEIIIDTGCDNCGLPLEIFSFPKLDYTNSVQVFSIAPLKRLQLSVVEHGAHIHDQRTDLLSGVLGVTPSLEDLDLKYSIPNPSGAPGELFNDDFLRMHCPRLKRFALHLATTTNSWLFNVIKSLENLEYVVLDRIQLDDSATNNDIVFHRLQQHYAGRCSRGPRFSWVDALCDQFRVHGSKFRMSRWLAIVEEELDAFLYDGGEFPLAWLELEPPYYFERRAVVKPNVGWILDARDPTVRIRNTEASAANAMAMRSWPVYQPTALLRGR
ncbi:hypothetical protein E8E12_006770 [Didymella heteroderae]|uniref:F-box domain-containing protein n=1 Tax=Didymella heteroderae TaxID=1769908 RepID=A0A9P4WWJ0_9PLEO|nr:hypothetical protein E8E12_006770 [Didymella heteroderae]